MKWWLPLAIVVSFACGVSFGALTGASTQDELREIQKTQARQSVDLEDARERIQRIEHDLDVIAPHQVPPR